MRARVAAVICVGAALVAAYAWRRRLTPPPRARHVFINETKDHRVDESIQVSILGAFARTGVQNAVVITDRHDADQFGSAAADLFRRLDLGRATGGRAILYLFSPARHVLKIEVGYALEATLPDATVRGFEMAAKTFVYSDRWQDFWAELINTMNIAIAEKNEAGYDFSTFAFTSGGAGVTSKLYTATPDQLAAEFKTLPPDARPEFAPDGDVRVSLARYLASLRAGVGDANLPLLGPESRAFRAATPQTTYQLYRNARMYDAAGVERIIEDGRFAYVVFKPGPPVLPLVFERVADRWLAQEPLSWSLFQRFEDSSRVFLKFPLRAGSPEFRALLGQRFGRPLYDRTPVDVSRLDAADDVTRFYFRTYWIDRVALELGRRPVASLPEDLLWLDLDALNGLGRFSEFLGVMEQLAQRRPRDANLAKSLEFYRTTYVFRGPEWRLSL